ncbi:hypothetical protein BVRB_2g029940 [Beta vulgaris subsp. vulgaris]|uniref:uncharacterized protein LOC104908389 n=1 Tax=Beta vulgaris subsp. vulgaris TaxID=3555 RepID=UPI00054021D8|nr:uncharacterized protein LOC104908389 [Beta vulgaris subsp. vulgaris]KMT18893.1 hypothetical protein BVRB_2g029940 [Beta vulgaris subsp. vulgaris]
MPSNTSTKVGLMKENMKPFPRARALSSKENRGNVETGETSFRVYYGETGAAVPFMWESQPGTPKHPIFDKNDNILPPLTPPPSYCGSRTFGDPSKKGRKYKVFRAIFYSIARKSHSHVTPTSSLSSCNSYSSPLSWSSSSTSSTSPQTSPRRKCNKARSHRRSFSFCSPREKSPLFYEGEEDKNVEYSTSSMCFGFKKQQGCYSMQ